MDEKLQRLLKNYQNLPEFIDSDLDDVNQISAFGDKPIHTAAVRGNIEELELLFSNGADLNDVGEYAYTPLLYAVEQGHIEAVKWLISKGADINLKNQDGSNALAIAEQLKYKEIQNLLLTTKNDLSK